jgi:hypothetical protein
MGRGCHHRVEHHEERPMSPEPVDVTCERSLSGWTCVVTVGDPARGHQTEHQVAVSYDDLARLAPGAEQPHDLVERSFEFLLLREPKESILRRFDLALIGRYFPEYEATIRRP